MGNRKITQTQYLWGRGIAAEDFEQPTEFEKKVEQLGLLSDLEMRQSTKLREWAKAHRYNRYVPSSLLYAWGLEINEEWFSHSN